MKNKIMEDLMPYFVEGAVQQELINEMDLAVNGGGFTEDPKIAKTRMLANMIQDVCWKSENAKRNNADDDMVQLLVKQEKEVILKAIQGLSDLWGKEDTPEEKQEPEQFSVELGPGLKVMSPKGISYEVEKVAEDVVFLNDSKEVWKVDKSIVEKWIKK